MWTGLDTVVQDGRYALRMLGRSPGFTAVAVFSLALGIGANTAIFSFVDAILLKSLPVTDPDRLSLVRSRRGAFGNMASFGYPFFRELERRNDVFSGMAAWWPLQVNLTTRAATTRVQGELVSGGYFSLLGIRPAVGRLLTADDDGVEGAHPVCVVSYHLWQSRFGGDPGILQRAIVLNTTSFQIVGVTEPGFRGAELHGRYDIQIPMSMTKTFMDMERDSWSWTWLRIIARRKPAVSMQQAQARLDVLAREVDAERRRQATSYYLVNGRQGFASLPGRLRDPILVSMGLSALVLLIACANLANLLLAKMSERRREVAIRLSLGATRSRLIGQLLVESLMLAFIGAGCGLLLARVLDRTLAALLFEPTSTPSASIGTDAFVLAFTTGVSIAAAILFGLAPAIETTRVDLTAGLSEAPRTGGSGRAWLRRTLITAQIAVCLILVFGAGLFARTLRNLRTIDLGFHADHLVVATFNPEEAGYQPADARAFAAELLRRARLIPDVEAAAIASIGVLSGGMFAGPVTVPGHEDRGEREPNNNFNQISPEYFRTLRIPVLRGRDFTERDDAAALAVAIVNERFVDYYWPGQDPIGRHIKALGKDVEIIGVVKTAKYQRLREEPPIIIYRPLAQRPMHEVTLHLRTRGDTAPVAGGLKEQLRQLDAKLSLFNITTLTDQLNMSISSERVLGLLSFLFGGLATLVASAGLYGVIAYAAVRRTREIGVRLAIGARRSDIIRLFVGEALALAALGIAIGTPAALGCARLFQTLLYGLDAGDPVTLAAAATTLLAVAWLAALLPARRAARLNPMVALRYE